MDLGTHDPVLSAHLSRLVEWTVQRVALGLFLGAVVGLLVGAVGWDSGHFGWVVASPGLGLLAFAGVLLLGHSPDVISDDE